MTEKLITKQLYSLWLAMIQALAMLSVVKPCIVIVVEQFIHMRFQVPTNHWVSAEPYSKLHELG